MSRKPGAIQLRHPSMKRIIIFFTLLCLSAFKPVSAADCKLSWNISEISRYGSGEAPIQFKDKAGNKIIAIELSYITTFLEAHDKIYFEAAKLEIKGTSKLESKPQVFLCPDKKPNAFAVKSGQNYIVGVTPAMLYLINRDEPMAAAIVGHEIAHLVHGHRSVSTGIKILNFLGQMAGTAAQLAAGIGGINVGGMVGGVLGTAIGTKFSRIQEEEADATGLVLLKSAGYSPTAFAEIATKIQAAGGQGLELLSTHPSWEARAEKALKTAEESNKEGQGVGSNNKHSVDPSAKGVSPLISSAKTERDSDSVWKRAKVCLSNPPDLHSEESEVAPGFVGRVIEVSDSTSCKGEKTVLSDIKFRRIEDYWITPVHLSGYEMRHPDDLAYFEGQIASYEGSAEPRVRLLVKQYAMSKDRPRNLEGVAAEFVGEVSARARGVKIEGLEQQKVHLDGNEGLELYFQAVVGSARARFYTLFIDKGSSIVAVSASSLGGTNELLAAEARLVCGKILNGEFCGAFP